MATTGGREGARGEHPDTGREVVVGVAPDGAGRVPVRWAARWARDHGLPLRLVRAFTPPRGTHPAQVRLRLDPASAVRARARADLDEAAEHAHDAAPGLSVRTDLVEAGVYGALRTSPVRPRLLVVGRDRWGRAPGPRGPAARLCRDTATPVAVVPGTGDAAAFGPPEVVGLDRGERRPWLWRPGRYDDRVVLLLPPGPRTAAPAGPDRSGVAP